MATEENSIEIMDVTVEDYCRGLDQWLRRYRGMNLARWKLLQNTAISVLVGILALEAGADPTVSVVIIALINGISIAELATIWGISIELRGEGPSVELDRDKKKQNEKPEEEIERR